MCSFALLSNAIMLRKCIGIYRSFAMGSSCRFENGGSACSIKVVPAVELVPVRNCRWPEFDRPVVLNFARRDDPGESARILSQSADNGAPFDIAPVQGDAVEPWVDGNGRINKSGFSGECCILLKCRRSTLAHLETTSRHVDREYSASKH
jgi:hypothetical protein